MMNAKENIYTLPNALSAYRLLMVPVIIWSLVDANRPVFVALICINLVTDILDGLIARAFKLCTEFGARLDSLADMGTFLLAICGFWVFESGFVRSHILGFGLIFGFYLLGQAASLLKFRRQTSFHLYSSKVLGYVQGIFIFTFFVFGYSDAYFKFMVAASCLAEAEVLLVVLALDYPRSNARSIFHVLNQKRHGTL